MFPAFKDLNPKFQFELYNCGFEDIELHKQFDIAFSSPPCFIEEYAVGSEHENDQSIKKYPNRKDWNEKFLKKVVHKSFEYLKVNGIFGMHQPNPERGATAFFNEVEEYVGQLNQMGWNIKLVQTGNFFLSSHTTTHEIITLYQKQPIIASVPRELSNHASLSLFAHAAESLNESQQMEIDSNQHTKVENHLTTAVSELLKQQFPDPVTLTEDEMNQHFIDTNADVATLFANKISSANPLAPYLNYPIKQVEGNRIYLNSSYQEFWHKYVATNGHNLRTWIPYKKS